VAATEEAKRQHDEAMEAERTRELEEFYSEESAKEQERFEAWRKRKRGRKRRSTARSTVVSCSTLAVTAPQGHRWPGV
jgi:hypothetical protein